MAVRRRTLLRRSQSSRRSIRPNVEPLEDRMLLASFLVNLTSDQDDADPADGNCDIDMLLAGDQCTLRAAIQQSNVSAGVPDEIQFNIGTGGPQTIVVPKALPTIIDTVSIDGTTQPPQVPGGPNFIELDGQNAGAFSGLSINTVGTSVHGLVINRFGGSGIVIQGGGNHVISGNFIGTDGTGSVALPNAGDGISIFNSRMNTIGGANPGDGNLLSGNNGNGIAIFGNGSAQNLIFGNRIGLNAAGNGPLPNGLNGVHVNDSPGNTVGGSTAQARNVISANLENGVRITGAAATGNVVLGNSIGTDANSTVTDPDGTPGTGDELGNRMHGVRIDGAPANRIGGTGAEEFNIVAGNQMSGVNLVGATATDNLLRNNFIGTNTDGIPGLGNFGPGIFIQGASKNTIGGPQPADRNVIAFNTGDGVLIVDGAANRITRNVIHTNGELGIDLAPEGPNFPQDADPGMGANNLQNFPELTPAAQAGTSTSVRGTLTSIPDTVFTVEFFRSVAADGSGFGEGQTFLATFDIPIDASGVANINELIPLQLPVGTVITATATDPNGNTSEFSNAVLVTSAGATVIASTPSGSVVDPVSFVDFVFNEAMDTSSFNFVDNPVTPENEDDVPSFTGPGGKDLKPAVSGFSWLFGDTVLRLNFLIQGAPGDYSIDIGPQILRVSDGAAMDQNNNGTPGEVPGDQYTASFAILSQVDLRVAVTDNPDPVIAGSGTNNLVYTVTVTNDGPSDASSVMVDLSNVLPAGASFVSTAGDGMNNFDGVGTDLWTIGLLALGASANLTVTYTVGAATAHNAIVSLTADNAKANEPLASLGNDADTETTTVNRSADLSIDKADTPDPVLPGGTVTYTLTIQNAGPSDAAAVQVIDTLPAGVTFVSAMPALACNQVAGVVTCNLGTLAAGASTQVSIEVTIDPAAMGVITNTAAVASTTFDPIRGNNMTTEDTTIAPPDLIVTEFTTTAADRGRLAIRYTIAGTPPPAIEFAFFGSTDARFDPGDTERPPRVGVVDPTALTVGDHVLTIDGGAYAGLINDPSTPFVVTRGAAVDAAGNPVREADLNNNDVTFLGVFHHGPFPSPLVVRGRDDTDRSNGVDLPADNADDVITIMGGATVVIGSSLSTVPVVLPSALVSEIDVLGLGGNDTITGDATVRQPLRLRGGAGDDMLTGGSAADALLGGAGDDTLRGGLGDDVMEGGGGTDTADFSVLPTKVVVNLLAGTARGQGRDTLAAILNVIGSAGRDRITGNAAPNILLGGAGNDVIVGGDGGDLIDGGAGNDCVCGGAGDDTMDGDAGNDRMDGGDGDDEMRGGAGNDIICGGDGNDMLSGDTGDDSMDGGAGIDALFGGLDFDFVLFDLFDALVDLGGVGKDGGKAFRA